MKLFRIMYLLFIELAIIVITLDFAFSLKLNDKVKSNARKIFSGHFLSRLVPGNYFETTVNLTDSVVDMTTLQISVNQLKRIFSTHAVIEEKATLWRVIFGWIVLLTAKFVALSSPLFFKELINYSQKHESESYENFLAYNFCGLILGFGLARFFSGIIQFVGELVVLPVTINASIKLPIEAYEAALSVAHLSSKVHSGSEVSDPASLGSIKPSQMTGIGFTIRTLDKGLFSSGLFLYRALYNLLPSLVEVGMAIFMIAYKAGHFVGFLSALVGFLYIYMTGNITQQRVPLLRAQKINAREANLYVEDALVNAESVAAFGTRGHEVSKYISALERVNKSTVAIRLSFSRLKLYQALVRSLGISVVAFATSLPFLVKTYPAALEAWPLTRWITFPSGVDSLSSNLILVQALFSQLFTPLDQFGQHFRDCLTAAEDLRELEVMKANVMRASSPPMDVCNANSTKASDAIDDNSYSGFSIHISNLSAAIRRPSGSGGGDCQEASGLPWNVSLSSLLLSRTPSVNSIIVGDESSPIGSPGHSYGSLDASMGIRKRFQPLTTVVTTTAIPPSNEDYKTILRNISIAIPAGGHVVGIVGPSGSGKSTLMRVLLGLDSKETEVTQAKQIFINGYNVSESPRLQYFSYVGQDNDLFKSLTIQENIEYSMVNANPPSDLIDPAARQEALCNAIADAELIDLLGRLPEGLQANLGLNGRLFSGGERQRICLARAFYRQELTGGILILDEGTSKLDAFTEGSVIDAIYARSRRLGVPTLMISHRLATVQRCRTVVVIKDGELHQEGRPDQLLADPHGWYAQAWNLQQQQQQQPQQ